MMSTALASMRLLVATLILLVSLEAMAQTPQRVAAPAQPLLKAADKARAPIIGLTMIMLTRHGADMPVFDAPLLSAVAASVLAGGTFDLIARRSASSSSSTTKVAPLVSGEMMP